MSNIATHTKAQTIPSVGNTHNTCYYKSMSDNAYENYVLTEEQQAEVDFQHKLYLAEGRVMPREEVEAWAKKFYGSGQDKEIEREIEEDHKKAREEGRPLLDIIQERTAKKLAKRAEAYRAEQAALENK